MMMSSVLETRCHARADFSEPRLLLTNPVLEEL